MEIAGLLDIEMRKLMARGLVFVLAALWVCAERVEGAIVNLTAQDVGSYTVSTHLVNNYTAGNANGFDFRNYAIFDLTSLGGTVVSAVLRADSGGAVGRNDDVVLSFRSYGGSIPALTGATANFADLANGTEYASQLVPATFPANSPLDVTLNAAALADINAATGAFAITGSQPIATPTSFLFGDVTAGQVSLILDVQPATIPEPSTFFFMIVAVGLLVCRHVKRKARIGEPLAPEVA